MVLPRASVAEPVASSLADDVTGLTVVALSQSPPEAAPQKPTQTASSRFFALPSYQNNPLGRTHVYVQNVSPRPAQVTLRVYDAAGRTAAESTVVVPTFGQAMLAPPVGVVDAFTGAAMILADGEIIAAVELRRAGQNSVFFDAVGLPSPVAAFPLVQKHLGAATSLALQNVTDRPAQLSLMFFSPQAGSLDGPPVSLAPFSSTVVDLAQLRVLPEGFNGSAVVRADNVAIAGAATIGTSDGAAYAATSRGADRLLVPTLGREGSDAVVLNLSAASTEVSVFRPGSTATAADRRPALSGQTLELTSSDRAATLAVDGGGGARLAALVRAGPMLIGGVSPETRTTYVPAFGDPNQTVTVQNLGSGRAAVTALFFGADGSAAGQQRWAIEVGATVSATIGQLSLPAGFAGSAILTANEPVGVIVR